MAKISYQHFNISLAGGFRPASVTLVSAIFATDPVIPAEVQTLLLLCRPPSCVDDDQGAAAPADEEPLRAAPVSRPHAAVRQHSVDFSLALE